MPRQPATDPGCACGSRRRFLAGLITCLPAASAAARIARADGAVATERRLHLINTHTGEVLDARYFVDGTYSPQPVEIIITVATFNWSNPVEVCSMFSKAGSALEA